MGLKIIFLLLGFPFIALAQSNAYLYNYKIIKMSHFQETKHDVFYDTCISTPKLDQSINKRRISVLLDSLNNPIPLKLSEIEKNHCIELFLLGNSSFSEDQILSERAMTDNYFNGTASYTPEKNLVLPGAYLNYQFEFGRRKHLKYFFNIGYSYFQNKYKRKFTSDPLDNSAVTQNITWKNYYEDFTIHRQVTCIIPQIGIQVGINKQNSLELSCGLNTPISISYHVTGITKYTETLNGQVTHSSSQTYSNQNIIPKYKNVKNEKSVQIKYKHQLKLLNNKVGLTLGTNLHNLKGNLSNWFFVGVTYYFSKKVY